MKKGEIIVFERGEYDSFDYFDPVIVLKSFSKKKISQKFAEEHKKNWRPAFPDDWYSCSPHEFYKWLIDNEYVRPLNSRSWHIGSYGEFESEFDQRED